MKGVDMKLHFLLPYNYFKIEVTYLKHFPSFAALPSS